VLEGFFLKLRNATCNNMPLSLKANQTSFNLSMPSMDAKKNPKNLSASKNINARSCIRHKPHACSSHSNCTNS
jgi:hypothetical protein